MNDHSFCRAYLADVMADVRKHYTPAEIKAAWAWTDGRNYEFHGPADEYYHDVKGSDCLWSTKAGGWFLLLEKKGVR